MEQIQEQQQSSHEMTFHDYVDMAIVFGCIPALVLNVIFWAVAVAFSIVRPLDSIMALFVTLLLAFVGIVLIIRYVDVFMQNVGKYNAAVEQGKSDDEAFGWTVGAAAVCLSLAACIIGSLSTAGALEGWHYTLMGGEILLVGYQTWRVFVSRNL